MQRPCPIDGQFKDGYSNPASTVVIHIIPVTFCNHIIPIILPYHRICSIWLDFPSLSPGPYHPLLARGPKGEATGIRSFDQGSAAMSQSQPDPPSNRSDASPDLSSSASTESGWNRAPAPAFAATTSAHLSAPTEYDSQAQPQQPPTQPPPLSSLSSSPPTTRRQPQSSGNDNDEPDAPSSAPHFTPEEEATLLAESNTSKATANTCFTAEDYSSAITHYDRALASCPTYLEYECAVLRSNISASHLKLQDWKAAINAATAALDGLERLLPGPKLKSREAEGSTATSGAEKSPGEGSSHVDPPSGQPSADGDAVVELEGNDAEVSAQLADLQLSDQRRADIARIRSKSLLRRARARSQIQTWAELQGAQDDYTLLASAVAFPDLPRADRRVVELALRELPLRVKAAREREMGEMMGKLKELGNGLLKPFGLSTDMFKVQQGDGGGYNISVDQGK